MALAKKKKRIGKSSKPAEAPAIVQKQQAPPEKRPETIFASLRDLRERRREHYAEPPLRIIYYTSLLVLLVCNFAVSLFLVPFVLILSSFKFYAIVVLLGLVFGWLFNILLVDIENLEPRHHVLAIVVIPVMAIINFFSMITISNKIAEILSMQKYSDPTVPSIIYAIVFLLPYAVSLVKDEHKIRTKQELQQIQNK